MLFGFDLKIVSLSEKSMMHFITGDLFFAICEVGHVKRGRAKKIRRLEDICKMCFKVCHNFKWQKCMTELETQLNNIEATKADINDLVNGFGW